MKKLVTLFCLSIVLYACQSGSYGASKNGAPPLDLSGFTIIEIPGSDMKRVIKYGADGLMKEEGTILGNLRTGAWVVYHETREVPKSIANFINDNYNGTYMEFNPQGQVTLVCGYVNNQLSGNFTRFQLGRKTEEGSYKDGLFDGVHKKYFTGKDLLQQESAYKNGKLDGITKYYNEEGKVLMEYVYKNGEKVSGGITEGN